MPAISRVHFKPFRMAYKGKKSPTTCRRPEPPHVRDLVAGSQSQSLAQFCEQSLSKQVASCVSRVTADAEVDAT
jgi:hypothetical protein